MADVFETTDARRIVGGVGTGKTQHLIERAAELLREDDSTAKAAGEDGAADAHVLVLCATPQAARTFVERLAAHAGADEAARAVVTTPRALALEALSSEDAVRWSGREPRLLADFEEKFLMEDMKVSGLRPRRLREMLRFFYRSWSELVDDDPAWLLPGEESDVHALLKANLSFTRSLVEPEAANLAVKYLRKHADARSAVARSHVLVDDYQMLSRASQMLANLVAKRSIAVAGDPAACVKAYDSYPYADGLDEFLNMHPNAFDLRLSTCRRSQASARAAQALLEDPCMADAGVAVAPDANATSDNARVLVGESPANEFALVADLAACAVKDGTSASRIAVATPNGTWSRNIVAALQARGLHAEALPPAQPIRGDIRDNAKCIPARMMTALDLAANPNDAVAWRCWCGYGDYLVNSAAIANLRAFADKRRIGLVEALRAVGEGAEASGDRTPAKVMGAQRVAAAYRTGLALIEGSRALHGRALLDELARRIGDHDDATAPQVLVDLCLEDETAQDDAATMARRARERLLAPHLSDSNAIAVVPYGLMAGLSPDVLVASGFVNGFVPSRDYFDAAATPLEKQKKMHAEDTRRVYALAGKAGRQLVVSRFEKTDLESAGMLKLKIARIRMEDGLRMCAIPPSDFLERIVPAEQ